jgi:uncharacterized membrane protein YjgN (DUF898 family)
MSIESVCFGAAIEREEGLPSQASVATPALSAHTVSAALSPSEMGSRRRLPRLPNGAVDTWPAQFHSDADDYVTLWFQGLLLTVFSLGLGLPWARLRCRRHLLQHTQLGGHGLDDQSSPWAMLARQLLMLALLAGVVLAAVGSPVSGLIAFTITVLVWPMLWLVDVSHSVNGLSWGQRPLAWQGRLSQAWLASAALQAAVLAGGWLAAAWWAMERPISWSWCLAFAGWFVFSALLCADAVARLAHLRQSGARLGPLPLRWQAHRGHVRRACLSQMLQAAGLAVALAGVALVIMAAGQAWIPAWSEAASLMAAALITLMWLLVSWWQWQARLFRLLWDQTGNRSLRFRCRLSARSLLGEHLQHAFLVVSTAGLFWPWVQHRAWAQRTRATTLRSRVALQSVKAHWPVVNKQPEIAKEQSAG